MDDIARINDQLKQGAHAQAIRDRRFEEKLTPEQRQDAAIEKEVQRRVNAQMGKLRDEIEKAVKREAARFTLNSGQGIQATGANGVWNISKAFN